MLHKIFLRSQLGLWVFGVVLPEFSFQTESIECTKELKSNLPKLLQGKNGWEKVGVSFDHKEVQLSLAQVAASMEMPDFTACGHTKGCLLYPRGCEALDCR